MPLEGSVFISVSDRDKAELIDRAASCRAGLRADRDARHRAQAARGRHAGAIVNKVQEGRPHVVDAMRSGRVQLVFNTTEGAQAISDSFSLRRTALTHGIPYYTTVAGARAAVQAIGALREGSLEVAPCSPTFDRLSGIARRCRL